MLHERGKGGRQTPKYGLCIVWLVGTRSSGLAEAMIEGTLFQLPTAETTRRWRLRSC